LRDALWLECRYALRGLRRSPAFTAGTIAVLALAIGANSAIFSVVHGVLLRPLPYRDAERLVAVQCERQYAQARGPVPATFGLADLGAWQALSSFDAVAFVLTDAYVLEGASGSQVLSAAVVSSTFFPGVDGPFVAGRALAPGDRAAPLVVISERLANQLFDGPERAVGTPLRLNSRPYTVAGVASRAFALPASDVDVWLSAEHEEAFKPRTSGFRPLGRLGPGATIAQAQGEMGSLSFGTGFRATAVPLRDQVVGDARPTLMLLWAALGLALAAGCANVANLLLARNSSLARDRAVQLALGASRRRVLLRAVAEGGMLAAAGAALGLALAFAVVRVVVRLGPEGLPLLANVGMNGPVLLFTTGLAVFTALAVGALPTIAWSLAPTTLTTSARVVVPATRRLGRALCIAEFAIAMVLLVGATLVGRSLFGLLRTDIGVAPEGVTAASLRLGSVARRDTDLVALAGRLVERARALPGVTDAGVGSSLPPRTPGLTLTLKRKGDVVDYAATAVTVTPGYLEALGVRLLGGRFFEPQDDDAHPPVVIMSGATARRFFGDEDPIGRTLTLPTLRDGVKGRAEMTVVGVVAPLKYAGLAAEADEQVYRPFAQQPWGSGFLIVRAPGEPAGLESILRQEIAAVDRALPVVSIRPLESIVSEETTSPRVRSMVLGVTALLGVTIAAVGLYSVVAYSVSQRSAEIAVRMALGAGHRDVSRMVVKEGLVLGAAGTVAGLAAACALAGSLRALLYSVTAVDPASYVASAGLLLVIAIVASYVPARRASRVEPVAALRAE
jgi:putative ABC transport system permease protein